MIKISVNNFNLKETITCGQIFRYEVNDDNSYTVVIKDRVIKLWYKDNILYVDSNNQDNLKEVVEDYLDLKRDYEKIDNELIDKNPDLNDVIKYCSGLKMIQQDPFETLISYIISANNRVPMISKVVNNIAYTYGKKVVFDDKDYYLFPSALDMKSCTKEVLRNLKAGFRDEYVYDVVNRILSGEFNLDNIENMDSYSALEYLKTNKGIGDKVASCILLFAYSRFDVYPIDTWVKKYMKDNFNIDGINEIKKYSKQYYGDYSGLVIQYMFNYSRNLKKAD